MNDNDDIKRRIRKLKKLEMIIRFGSEAAKPDAPDLVWDTFFDLHDGGTGRARHTLHSLSTMNKQEYKSVVDEFFFHVYFRYYKENGIVNAQLHDPDTLSLLGLPLDADVAAIKKKFRELAMKYHPDTGGDHDKFITLMENYNRLIERGK